MKISAHFTLAELEVSQIATRHGLDNRVPDRLMPNLGRLVGALEQVRQIAGGHPLRISSGYRSQKLNTLVKGSQDSAHIEARAADFTIPAYGSPLEVCRLIAWSGVQFDQLIHEFGAWVHISVPRMGVEPRNQTLTLDRQGPRGGLWEARE